MSTRNPLKPPFKRGSRAARDLGKKGGRASAALRKAASVGIENATLDALQPLGVLQFMDRFGMTEESGSWAVHRMMAKVLDRVALTDADLVLYRELTGRSTVPTNPRTVWLIFGRRSGKSHWASVVAIHAATRRYPKLAAGEKAHVLLLAANREQAGVLFDYIDGAFTNDPELARLVASKTRHEIVLVNRVRVQVTTSNYRAVRSFTAALVIADESAFWWADSGDGQYANPDKEVLRALRPTLATLRGRLLCVTTPFARRGAAWDAFSRYHGQDDPEKGADSVLVLNGPSRLVNPTLDEKEIELDVAEDPEHASAEWGGQWRADKEGYVRIETLDAVTDAGVIERPPQPGIRYRAAVDVAGGSGKDSYTLSIGHVEGEQWIQDLLREWRPAFSPGAVTSEVCGIVSVYGIREIVGDRYGGGFPPEEFYRHGVRYVRAERDASAYYVDALALLNTGRVRLVDNDRMRRQFTGLRREHTSGGQTKVVHRQGQHDDLSNVTALGMVEALGLSPTKKRFYAIVGSAGRTWSNDPRLKRESPPDTRTEFERQQAEKLAAHADATLLRLKVQDQIRAAEMEIAADPIWYVGGRNN